MPHASRKKRDYLLYLDRSIDAIHLAIDSFNRVYNCYKIENTLILLTNAWELLCKALLLKKHVNIRKNKNHTISAEEAIAKLLNVRVLDQNQADVIQQIISLRNQAAHDILPNIPEEIQQHLFFFSCKFFKDTICNHFSSRGNKVSQNYLSISFAELHTYADTVKNMISCLKRASQDDRKLIWLLERGVRFNGVDKYIAQDEFERQYKQKHKKILPHLSLKRFLDNSDMVRIVPIQAPRNFTADISLRKGDKNVNEALPVSIKKTDVEKDYPYLTSDIGKKLGKNTNFISKLIIQHKLKGNPEYHQSVRASKSNSIHRYSDSALSYIKGILQSNPDYNPYKNK